MIRYITGCLAVHPDQRGGQHGNKAKAEALLAALREKEQGDE